MPYRTGEEPIVGDVVTDSEGRTGFVSHIVHFGGGAAELAVQWDDGTLGIGYFEFDKLVLVQRAPSAVGEE
jgi:hypothetical protein